MSKKYIYYLFAAYIGLRNVPKLHNYMMLFSESLFLIIQLFKKSSYKLYEYDLIWYILLNSILLLVKS